MSEIVEEEQIISFVIHNLGAHNLVCAHCDKSASWAFVTGETMLPEHGYYAIEAVCDYHLKLHTMSEEAFEEAGE